MTTNERVGPPSNLVPTEIHGGVDHAELLRMGISLDGLVDFSSNLLPQGPSARVRRAVRDAVIDAYPDRECTAFRSAICQGYGTDVSRICVGNGCIELIHLVAATLLNAGDSVLIVGPTFSEYKRASQIAGAQVDCLVALASTGFSVPVVELEQRLDGNPPRLVWICNPNNPTGIAIPRERIVHWVRRYPDVTFVIDESYVELCDVEVSVLAETFANLIVLRSMTKSHSIAGLRLGFAVASSAVAEQLRQRQTPWSVNSVALAAGVAAVSDSACQASCVTEMYADKSDFVAGLRRRGFHPTDTCTNFFLLPITNAREVRQRLMHSGFLVRDCSSFGVHDYLRLSVQSRADNRRLTESLAANPDAMDRDFRNQLGQLFRLRRDVRSFRRESLPESTMHDLIEAACLAPSVGLSQPWRFVSVSSAARRSAVIKEFELQNEIAAKQQDETSSTNYRKLKLAGLRDAPEHLAVMVQNDPRQGRGLGRATMPESVPYSVVAAIQNFWLAARSEGVGVGWVSILRPDCVQALLDVPADWSLIAYLCVGYPDEPSQTVPELERCGWEQRSGQATHWLQR